MKTLKPRDLIIDNHGRTCLVIKRDKPPGATWLLGQSDNHVATCYGETLSEAVDNAKICAAAPKLLEALRGMVNIVTHPKATRADCVTIAHDARALLATLPQ